MFGEACFGELCFGEWYVPEDVPVATSARTAWRRRVRL